LIQVSSLLSQNCLQFDSSYAKIILFAIVDIIEFSFLSSLGSGYSLWQWDLWQTVFHLMQVFIS